MNGRSIGGTEYRSDFLLDAVILADNLKDINDMRSTVERSFALQINNLSTVFVSNSMCL